MSDYHGSSDDESVHHSVGHSSTGVTLGFVDVPVSPEEQPYLEDTFIGGKPLWLEGVAPPKELLVCKSCGELLALLMQTFAPLPGSANDRVVYLFGCPRFQCRRKKGSIRCVKGVKKNDKKAKLAKDLHEKLTLEQENEKQYEIKLKSGLFGTGSDKKNSNNPFAISSNPFAGGSESSKSQSNPFAKSNPFEDAVSENSDAQKETKETSHKSYSSVAATKEASKPVKLIKSKSLDLPEYPGYILYLEKETLGSDDDVLPPIPKNIEIESDENNDAESIKQAIQNSRDKKGAQVEEFKSEVLKDAEFQKFSKNVAHNPGQVLRYDLGGKPLLYSSRDSRLATGHGVPDPAHNPKSKRHYELQMMLKAIIDLEADITNVMEGMEWGTILVFTDVEDFVPQQHQVEAGVGYVEEWVEVEWEEQIDYGLLQKQ